MLLNGVSEPSHKHHPIDDIEPLNTNGSEFREAALRQLHVLNRALDFICESRDPITASWQVAFALGSACCAGRSMLEIARNCGVSKACISKGARNFCEKNHLPPSFYMKSEKAVESYRITRKSQLTPKLTQEEMQQKLEEEQTPPDDGK
jgi:hypothetical protein